jgi:2-amino-4-hydroxy-6-hydroxymethyldihydropteridine diphosphokinase
MAQVFVGLGSNLGDRRKFLRRAIIEMEGLKQTVLKNYSFIYETEPLGLREQPIFLNMVAELDSSLQPRELLQELKDIEKLLGRTKTERWGPREIDVDLLYYSREIINEEGLLLPHPEVANRRFVLVPMKDIAANFLDPLKKQTIAELLIRCPDTSAVRKLPTPFLIHIKA